MKTKQWIELGLIGLLSAARMAAGTVEFAWNANPPEDNVLAYHIYARVTVTNQPPAPPLPGVETYQWLAGTTSTNYALTNVAPGHHCWVLTASNSFGQSGYSLPVCGVLFREAPPGLPAGLQIQLRPGTNTLTFTFTNTANWVAVESSPDLATWAPWVHLEARAADVPRGAFAWDVPADPRRKFWRLRNLP